MEQAFSSVLASQGMNSFFASSASAGQWQGGATALSVLSSITAGRVARREADAAAGMSFFAADFARDEGRFAEAQAGLDARQEEIAGRARAAELQEQLAQTIGGQRVAFAASGVDPSRGTAARIQEQTDRRGQDDLAIQRSNTEIARLQAKMRGSTARRQAEMEARTLEAEGDAKRRSGRAAEISSYLDAGQTYARYRMSTAQRK